MRILESGSGSAGTSPGPTARSSAASVNTCWPRPGTHTSNAWSRQAGLCRRVGHFNQPPGQYTAWVGVRFRRDDDDDAGNEHGGDGNDAGTDGLFDSSPNGSDKAKRDSVQAV